MIFFGCEPLCQIGRIKERVALKHARPIEYEPYYPEQNKFRKRTDKCSRIEPFLLKEPSVKKIKQDKNRHRPKHRIKAKCGGKIKPQQAYIGASNSAPRTAYSEYPLKEAGYFK